jgi:hypothetical protein
VPFRQLRADRIALKPTDRFEAAELPFCRRPIADMPRIAHPLCPISYKAVDMSYQTDRRSRTRAIATYGVLLFVGAALGVVVRLGVITDHLLW